MRGCARILVKPAHRSCGVLAQGKQVCQSQRGRICFLPRLVEPCMPASWSTPFPPVQRECHTSPKKRGTGDFTGTAWAVVAA